MKMRLYVGRKRKWWEGQGRVQRSSPGKCLGQGGLWKGSGQRREQTHSEAWVSNVSYKSTRNSPCVLDTPFSKNMSALWNSQDWGHVGSERGFL